MSYLFTALADIKGDFDAAQVTFDAFREAALPGDLHQIILWNLRPSGTDEAPYMIDVEVEADVSSEEDAAAAFDAMREAVLPSEYGVTLFGLAPASAPAPAP